jgi:hypothetical protein
MNSVRRGESSLLSGSCSGRDESIFQNRSMSEQCLSRGALQGQAPPGGPRRGKLRPSRLGSCAAGDQAVVYTRIAA